MRIPGNVPSVPRFLAGRNFTTSYGYDAASNRTGFTDPENGSTGYAYDTLNRVQTLTPPAAISAGNFGFGYDVLSRRTSLTRPNSINTTYAYDNLSHLQSVTHAKGSTTLDGASYGLDNAGNRTSKTDLYANLTTNYGYDNIYELLSATQGGTTKESYTYDSVGNRLTQLGSASWSYNTSNELTARPTVSYTYDSDGNTQTMVNASGTTTYNWDYENRLTSVVLPGSGGTVYFKYDPFGRRIYKSSTSGTSVYAYDGDNLIEETNSSGTAVARYAQGLNIDEPLAMLRSGTTSFYEADGLGTLTSLSNTSGALANTYTYDSFGNLVASTGSIVNNFRYTGREWDTETSLYYYRARYYDPQSGRFLSEDPLGFGGDGTNFYVYAGNNPTDNDDPSGCGFINCAKALAELADALADLARREAEHEAHGRKDCPGMDHDKAIEQAKNRVRNAVAKAIKCIPADEAQRILDSIKSSADEIGRKIWNWLNSDPRENWPSIYGPKPGAQPVGPWIVLPVLPKLIPAV